MERTETRGIQVRDITVGGQNKVVVQSVCNIRAGDVEVAVAQILQLKQVGCELARMAIIDETDAAATIEIRKHVHIPLVADIHYNYRLATAAVEADIDRIHLNPRNIGSKGNVKMVVAVCKEYHIPIRIDANSGSLEKDIHEKYGRLTARGVMEGAQYYVQVLEELDSHDIYLSFKSSDPLLCIGVYHMASTAFPYPLHLGVTETGTFTGSVIRSNMALGALLNEGIGDTICINVNGDPVNEITIVKQLLKCCGLLKNTPNLVTCPTRGRTAWDMQPVVNEMEAFLQTTNCDVDVAIMGCAVNGPGGAKHADIAIAGGRSEGLLIEKGEVIEKLPQEQMVTRLKEEILTFEKEYN